MVKVQLVLGPVVVSVVLNAFLFGLCVLQFSTYYASQVKTKPLIRLLIAWVMLLDTYHTITSVYLLWDYVVTNFNNEEILNKSPWPFPSTPIVTALASVPIQHYLAWRIQRFSGSWWIFGIVSAMSVLQGIFAFASAIKALLVPNISDFDKVIPYVDTWLGVAMACDLTITALLTKYLRQCRTGFRRTDNVIARIIRSSVETAAFAFFFCIMDFITFTIPVLQNTNFHLIFALPMGRIYTNTLMTTINSRSELRIKLDGVHDTTFEPTHPGGIPVFARTADPEHTGAVLTVDVAEEENQSDESHRRPSTGYDAGNQIELDCRKYEHSDAHGSEREVKAAPVA
ncbi:hypothetical protein PLICRDRAFT_45354 [Plicaturopsis crispa FD-325 SS-3]|uniref:Unplaced genomic scaffold PLICRscaffold_15, whole genome shotgun sequence n=1 Tax=Plicaturopsis crispa FD-325 SS-3 TaxID=944288 RepID=A0A0C9SYQ0_PLICR|nr:hypothetical protein PLICRDRAFT_45354 [Plicaturopsis crispa FD-325 SS-3]